MKGNYPILNDFIKENGKKLAFTYHKCGNHTDIDEYVKRRVLKRRSTSVEIFAHTLMSNNSLNTYCDYSCLDSRILPKNRLLRYAVSIEVNKKTDKEHESYTRQLEYILHYNKNLSSFSNNNYIHGYENIYEFSHRGKNLVTVDFDRKAYCQNVDEGGYRLTGESIIDISSGGANMHKICQEERPKGEIGFEVYLGIDGKVYLNGNGENGRCEVQKWKNIVSIDAWDTYIIGLTRDGRVLAAGGNDNGRCNVSEWTDIIDIAATEKMTFGLKANGTVISTMIIPELSKLKNIVGLAAGCFVDENGNVFHLTNNRIVQIDGPKLWYSNEELNEILASEEKQKQEWLSEKENLTNKLNGRFLFSGKRMEIEERINTLDSWINFNNSKGLYLSF